MINDVQVNGNQGKYDKKVQDESVRYGRNAVNNNMKQMGAIISQPDNPAPILNFSPTEEANNENIQKLEQFVKQNEQNHLKKVIKMKRKKKLIIMQHIEMKLYSIHW